MRKVNKKPIERIYPDDKRVKPQTIAHHKARYEFASMFEQSGRVAIDLACGTGYGTDRLRLAGYNVIGVDICEEAIKYARENFPENIFIITDIATCLDKQEKAIFDMVTFFEALEHLSKTDGRKLIIRIGKLLKKNGVFIMSIPRDINEKNNGFHKSKWGFGELKNTLESVFDEVIMLGQDWDTAEFSEEDVEKNDFYIAVCTNVN
jgi:2-polyprenyl-3-methyl-5-hydroxy-6-metoxy-1,4-benzoquinol methylase